LQLQRELAMQARRSLRRFDRCEERQEEQEPAPSIASISTPSATRPGVQGDVLSARRAVIRTSGAIVMKPLISAAIQVPSTVQNAAPTVVEASVAASTAAPAAAATPSTIREMTSTG